jgi:hypothetical protein
VHLTSAGQGFGAGHGALVDILTSLILLRIRAVG